ncbi:MAG: diguanylate cyclase [Cyanothece sp. SIO2G6]|nr:diguanylate cyclase [Cyanothece sp. SIO2G6]
MDASILVVGKPSLHHTIDILLADIPGWVIAKATDRVEAQALITAQQPDVLIIDASDSANLELSQWLHTQNRLSWIYQIFVGTITPTDQKMPSTLLYTNQSEIEYIDRTTTALDKGADSYLLLHAIADHVTNDKSNDIVTKTRQLAIAQIQAGLRRVKNDRELVQTNDLLSAIALSDPLTELNNRRAFEWELPRQVKMAHDQNTPISLLMLDIDFFKRINDNYGHLVGDQVLRMVANRLRHNLRFYDTPFRYGGEEFSIILSNTALSEATIIGQRICRLIAEQPFVIDPSLQLVVTMSIGGASLQGDDSANGLSLLQRADQNLLAAKSNGRNQIISSDTTIPSSSSTQALRDGSSNEILKQPISQQTQ